MSRNVQTQEATSFVLLLGFKGSVEEKSKAEMKGKGAGLALLQRGWDVWGVDGEREKTRGQAERLDHTHTSKDLSCQEVMHFFFFSW